MSFEIKKWSVDVNRYFTADKIAAFSTVFSCGLQNGMCTTYSGAVIRTTHVTGTLTDVGLIIGQAVFHPKTRKNMWKLKLLVPIYLSFCCGGFLAFFAYEHLKEESRLMASLLLGILSVAHLCYRKVFPCCEKRFFSKNDSKRRATNVNSSMVESPQSSFDTPESPTSEHICFESLRMI